MEKVTLRCDGRYRECGTLGGVVVVVSSYPSFVPLPLVTVVVVLETIYLMLQPITHTVGHLVNEHKFCT